MAIADFVSKRLQRVAFALLALAMVQLSLAAREARTPPAGAVIVPVSLVNSGSH